MLLLFQKCHFMYFEKKVSVSMVTAPAHSGLAALRPRSVLSALRPRSVLPAL